jgi:hypothetical protein
MEDFPAPPVTSNKDCFWDEMTNEERAATLAWTADVARYVVIDGARRIIRNLLREGEAPGEVEHREAAAHSPKEKNYWRAIRNRELTGPLSIEITSYEASFEGRDKEGVPEESTIKARVVERFQGDLVVQEHTIARRKSGEVRWWIHATIQKEGETECKHCGEYLSSGPYDWPVCFRCRPEQASLLEFWANLDLDKKGGPKLRLPRKPQRVLLGSDISSRNVVTLEQAVRDAGLYMIGITRSGKTSLLVRMMLADAAQDYGFMFIDPHGDAIDDLMARLTEHALERVVLLDVGDEWQPFGINFFDVGEHPTDKEIANRADQAVHVFKKLWTREEYQGWGARLEYLLRIICHTMIANPGYTLAEVNKLLTRDDFREQLVGNVTNTDVADFWHYDYDPETDREQREHRASTVNKVQQFILNPVMKNIVGQSKSTIDLRSLMDGGKIVLVKLALGDIQEQAVDLLGSVLVGMVLHAAYSRSDTVPDQRRVFHLYADEYQRFATSAFATLLSEAGKYAVHTTIAHQDRVQLRQLGATVAQIKAENLIVFHAEGGDASELAQQFDRTPPPVEPPEQYVREDVIDFLLHEGHPDPVIAHFISRYLRPIYSASKEVVEKRQVRGAWPGPSFEYSTQIIWPKAEHGDLVYNYNPADLRGALLALNALLYHTMAHVEEDRRGELSWTVCEKVKEYVGFGDLWDTLKTDLNPEIENMGPAAVRYAVTLVLTDLELGKTGTLRERLGDRQFSSVVRRMQTTQGISTEEVAEAEFTRIFRFYSSLGAVIQQLEVEPIHTEGGLPHEPIHQRTFDDREDEIANELAGLPPYTARVRLLQTTEGGRRRRAEHTIETLPLPHLSREDRDRLATERTAWLRERMLGLKYCKRREEVSDEIRRRQRRGGDEEPPDPPLDEPPSRWG